MEICYSRLEKYCNDAREQTKFSKNFDFYRREIPVLDLSARYDDRSYNSANIVQLCEAQVDGKVVRYLRHNKDVFNRDIMLIMHDLGIVASANAGPYVLAILNYAIRCVYCDEGVGVMYAKISNNQSLSDETVESSIRQILQSSMELTDINARFKSLFDVDVDVVGIGPHEFLATIAKCYKEKFVSKKAIYYDIKNSIMKDEAAENIRIKIIAENL